MKDEKDAGGTPAARGSDGPVGPREGRSSSVRWAGVVVAVVTLLAMGRLCGMEFTWWDDNKTIHHNPLMNPATWETLRHYWTHAYMGLYVPVTYTVWAGLAAIARVSVPNDQGISLNPWVFHSANVLVHVGNALLVYAILRRVVRKPWAAAAGALVFGVHPVQVEAVGWVSGMKDLLCGTCVLGAVWNYLVYAEEQRDREGHEGGREANHAKRWHYWAALVLTGVGTLCKPTAVVTPVLLGVVDLWVVKRRWRRVARDVWPFAAAVLPCVVWAKAVQNVGARAPVWARPGIAADALAFYLWKLVWPARLAVEYGHNPAHVMRLGWWRWTWLVPAAVGVWAWVGRRKRPALAAAAGLFVGGLLPVLGFAPFMFQKFSTTADHYLYLPMLGVAVAVAWAAARWSRWRGTAVVVGVVVAALASRTVVQAGYWADEETLDRHTLAVNPQSYVAHTNLAAALQYLGQSAGSPELIREAEWHLREAIRLEPTAVKARENLATIKIQQGKVDEAIQLLMDAIAVSDQAPPEEREALGPSHRALGAVLAKRGRLEEAAAQYRAALEYEPGSTAIEGELAAVEQRMKKKDKNGGEHSTSNAQR